MATHFLDLHFRIFSISFLVVFLIKLKTTFSNLNKCTTSVSCNTNRSKSIAVTQNNFVWQSMCHWREKRRENTSQSDKIIFLNQHSDLSPFSFPVCILKRVPFASRCLKWLHTEIVNVLYAVKEESRKKNWIDFECESTSFDYVEFELRLSQKYFDDNFSEKWFVQKVTQVKLRIHRKKIEVCCWKQIGQNGFNRIEIRATKLGENISIVMLHQCCLRLLFAGTGAGQLLHKIGSRTIVQGKKSGTKSLLICIIPSISSKIDVNKEVFVNHFEYFSHFILTTSNDNCHIACLSMWA